MSAVGMFFRLFSVSRLLEIGLHCKNSYGITFGIFVPLAFSFAQISSSHLLFWFSLGRWIPSFFAKKMPSLFG